MKKFILFLAAFAVMSTCFITNSRADNVRCYNANKRILDVKAREVSYDSASQVISFVELKSNHVIFVFEPNCIVTITEKA